MASPLTVQRTGGVDWTLMTAIHHPGQERQLLRSPARTAGAAMVVPGLRSGQDRSPVMAADSARMVGRSSAVVRSRQPRPARKGSFPARGLRRGLRGCLSRAMIRR
jgi:hypothetical protein